MKTNELQINFKTVIERKLQVREECTPYNSICMNFKNVHN